MISDTPEKMERRRAILAQKNIENLLANYKRKLKAHDYFGADKIAWILAKVHNIEGDTRYDASESNGDFEG
jgi:hypothetical protein